MTVKIDLSISPENCESRGYSWDGDKMYDPDAPEEVNQEFVDLTNDGGLLGEPASKTLGEDWYGIFVPLSANI